MPLESKSLGRRASRLRKPKAGRPIQSESLWLSEMPRGRSR